MAFRDYPFPPPTPSFAPHQDVRNYLQQFARDMRLLPHIQFDTRITDVRKSASGAWDVTLHGGHIRPFDAVIVAVGQYSEPDPWLPDGIDLFRRDGRTVLHSHEYKTPHAYRERDVLVVGAGASGLDIGVEIAHVARSVYVSHSLWKERVFGGHVEEVARVDKVLEGGRVRLQDGTVITVQDMLLCTGYVYRYPFLKEEVAGVHVIAGEKAVDGLVGHLYAREDPTLAFVGLVWKVVPFPLFQDQALFLAALWGGKADEKRLKAFRKAEDEDWEIAMMGEKRFLHRLGDRSWEYRRRLASVSGGAMPEAAFIEVANDSAAARKRDVAGYRRREYVVFGKRAEDWRVYVDGVDVTGMEQVGPRSRVPPDL